ncbi:MAG: B12-binding domain-containing radical SAM protein [Candidatus Omnitrophica bacterium]|nr:B12-binding domain-containing radical SAM protein [Candidatus Omnitrophota bacterium]
MKIVLANSIGKDKNGFYIIHSPSRWSEGVKSLYNWFAYYPWELAYTSSLLKRETNHKVKLVDGCLERFDLENYYRKILQEKPNWLIMESATRMIEENLELAIKIKKKLGTKIVFVGQHASAFPEELINKGVDYVCIGEYELTVLELLQGKDPKNILGLYQNPRRPLLDINYLPFPEDEDVRRIDYGIPGEPSSEYIEIQMYASRGCPRSCNFCVARNIYYAQANWRPRKIENIISEIKYLKNRYHQMEGIFFDEEVHNVNRDFVLNLCQAIKENGLNKLHYEAMCDIWFMDEEVLEAMREAGYYKIRFGIETASEAVANGINKQLDLKKLFLLLNRAKEIGFKNYGTFMFGAWNSTKENDLETIDLMKRLIINGLLDNTQISICTPQPGTKFYRLVKEKGYLVENDYSKFDGGNFSVVSYPKYKKEEIEEIKNLALKIRDHLYFVYRFKTCLWLNWLIYIWKKYGFWKTTKKIFIRFLKELNFLWQKFQ